MGAALANYRAIVWRVLEAHAAIPVGAGTATSFVVFDPHLDRFLLITVGWQGSRRIHSTAAHLALQDGKRNHWFKPRRACHGATPHMWQRWAAIVVLMSGAHLLASA